MQAPAGAELALALPALAAQINAAHDAAFRSAQSALDAAAQCGRLLLEAKAQVAHGEWLPWLEANTRVGARQSQKYMRLAKAPKSELTSHLTIDGALAAIADNRGETSPEIEPGSWEWCDEQLKGPFNGWDVIGSDVNWLATKLLHHAKLPAVANICLRAQGEHGFPILRLVPADELLAAIEALAPIAKGERDLPFDHASLNLNGVFKLWTHLKLMAERGLGQLITEFNYRDTIDDEQYSREFDSIKARWLGRLDLALQGLGAGARL